MSPNAKTPEPRKAQTESEIGAELASIYKDAAKGGDMSRLEKVYHSTFRNALVGLTVFFAVLAAASWAGFFLFSPSGGGFKGEEVSLVIEGPAEAKSGELVAYAVRYKNGEGTPLGTASLELRTPRQFKVQSVEPAQQDGAWRLGSIAPDRDGVVTIKGVFLAPIGKTFDMQAILTYRPADFNSEFQKVSTRGILVKDSVLDLTATAPAKILPGDSATIVYAYANRSQNAFEDVRFRPTFADGFVPTSASPAPDDDGYAEWTIPALAPDAEGKISVTGTFSSDAEGARETKGALGLVDANGSFETQKEAAASMEVLKGDLVTALILNGKSDDQSLRFGDTMRYAITYKNTGSAPLEDIEFAISLAASPSNDALRWNELKDKAKGIRDGNRIVWTKKQIPSLARIDAGDEGAIDLELPFIASPIPGEKAFDYGVTASLEAKIGAIDGTRSGRTAISRPIEAKAVSDSAFLARANFFDQDEVPVGSGPLPPKVGEATTYRVTWTVTNALHELSDLRLSAKLPPNVTWSGRSDVDAGDLRFDAATAKMLWTLNWMPTNVNTLNVSFDVTLTPTSDQLGKVPTLVDGAIFEAIDKHNGYPILLSASPLTTALEGDANAAGKGRVQ